jgi:hypothetical protein
MQRARRGHFLFSYGNLESIARWGPCGVWDVSSGSENKMASTAKPRGRALRLLRTVHAWMGIFIFPWVIVIGATGFYLNHGKLILSVIEGPEYVESRFDEWPVTEPVTR